MQNVCNYIKLILLILMISHISTKQTYAQISKILSDDTLKNLSQKLEERENSLLVKYLRQSNQIQPKNLNLEDFLNSCSLTDDPLGLKNNIIAGYELVGPCRTVSNENTINQLTTDINMVLSNSARNSDFLNNTQRTNESALSSNAEFHALLQAGIARLKTLRILRGIQLTESEMNIEVGLLCSESYGQSGCSESVRKRIKTELHNHQKAIEESINLGLEKSYTPESIKEELTLRFQEINIAWKKAWDLAKEKGSDSLEAQIAYSQYIETYSLAVSDPVGVMIFNHPFKQVPKSLDLLSEEDFEQHEFRPNSDKAFRIREADIETGLGVAVSQSMRHVRSLNSCRDQGSTQKSRLHCLLEKAPTAVGQALAENPQLANPGLCIAMTDVTQNYLNMQKNLGFVGAVTNFLDVISIPLMLAGGTGLLVKGLSSFLTRSASSMATNALTASSKRLIVSNVSNKLLASSGYIGITASSGRLSGGSVTGLYHASNYQNYTAAIQAAARTNSPEELERAIELRASFLQSLQDLKDGSFDFLPFGAFVHLARSEKIAELAGSIKQSANTLSQSERIIRGSKRLNSTLNLIKNSPHIRRTFEVAMKTKDLGSEAVTSMVEAIAKMDSSMRARILKHLELIKNDDSKIISFFRKIMRSKSC